MKGKEAVETIFRYCSLTTGMGFTVLYDLGNPAVAGILSSEGGLRKVIDDIIAQRMASASTLGEKLVSLCRASGVIWSHPVRGPAFQIEQELSEEEEQVLQSLISELDRLDTFIQL